MTVMKVFALVSFLDQSNGVANNSSREYEIPNCCVQEVIYFNLSFYMLLPALLSQIYFGIISFSNIQLSQFIYFV